MWTSNWFLTIAGLVVTFLIVTAFKGPRAALGAIAILSFAIPTWVKWTLIGSPIDARTIAVLASLGLYVIHPQGVWPRRLVISDFILLAYCSIHFISDSYHDGLHWKTFVRLYFEWCIPYVVARFAIQDWNDVKALAPWAAGVAIMLGVITAYESASRVNIAELIYGQRPFDQTPFNLLRFGFRRAYGTTMHPIFSGAMQTTLIPWCLLAGQQAVLLQRVPWGLAGLPLNLIGIAASMSRGPWVAGILGTTGGVLGFWRHSRITLLTISLVFLGGLLVAYSRSPDMMLKALEQLGSEADPEVTKAKVIFGDKELKSSSVRDRLSHWELYRLAFARSGFLGFGTVRTAGFPLDIPLGYVEEKTARRLFTCENVFLLYSLRFGWLGGGTFLAFVICATVYAFIVKAPEDIGLRLFIHCNFGMWLGCWVILNTVYMPHDHGWPILWSAGVVASLRAIDLQERQPAKLVGRTSFG